MGHGTAAGVCRHVCFVSPAKTDRRRGTIAYRSAGRAARLIYAFKLALATLEFKSFVIFMDAIKNGKAIA